MTSAKFWTPCPLVTVSNKPILLSFGPPLPLLKASADVIGVSPQKRVEEMLRHPTKNVLLYLFLATVLSFSLSVSRLAHILRLIERSVHAFSINDRAR